ncbi:unnamed protein product [Eruca vesicaria subsp. sativa]|uniref:Uncharacterized protein n=1 Tax=Eruca vesicaria subsp. sativa TaxID=29727 RepID=A0ABC8KFW3_ERUVS|nr:unnamed protein product [Eruca vesicaria subsp. sativa]
MGKSKQTAAATSSDKQVMHAASASTQPQLSDGEPEPSPPLNNPALSMDLPAATEELESFNTANEKAQSEESDEPHGNSHPKDSTLKTRPVHVTATTPEDIIPKLSPSPTASASTKTRADSASELKEADLEATDDGSQDQVDLTLAVDNKDEDAVELSSSSEGSPPIKARTKRIMKRLDLPASKKTKTGVDSVHASSQDVADPPKEVTVSDRVKSRKKGELKNEEKVVVLVPLTSQSSLCKTFTNMLE